MKFKTRLSRKLNILKLVCVSELEHINTIYLYTRSKHTKLTEVFLSPSRLDPNAIQ